MPLRNLIRVIALLASFLALSAESTSPPVFGYYINSAVATGVTGAINYFNQTADGATTTASAGKSVANILLMNTATSGFVNIRWYTPAAPGWASGTKYVTLPIPAGTALLVNAVRFQGWEFADAVNVPTVGGPFELIGWE